MQREGRSLSVGLAGCFGLELRDQVSGLTIRPAERERRGGGEDERRGGGEDERRGGGEVCDLRSVMEVFFIRETRRTVMTTRWAGNKRVCVCVWVK